MVVHVVDLGFVSYIAVSVFLVIAGASAPYLLLDNNGPAIRGTNITFSAHLMEYREETLHYTFDDGIEKSEVDGGINVTFQRNFARDLYSPNTYNMTVSVERKSFFVKKTIATNYTSFELGDNLFGEIIVLRNGSLSNESDEVGTGENLTMIADMLDGNGYLKDADFKCMWSVDMERFDLEGTSLNYTYHVPGMSFIAVSVFAILPSSDIVYGLFLKKLTVKVPVDVIDISGNPFIHHNEVLNLNVSWTGTPPFEYCWDIINSNETVESNFTCTVIVTYDSSFPVTWYFQKNGTYTFAVHVSNDVAVVKRSVEVVVFSVLPKSQLSTVIIPIVCSVLTLVIIAIGIAYYRQQRKELIVEVASFDFHDNSDSYPERTFFEQLWDSFRCRGCCSSSLSVRSDILSPDEEPLLT